MKKVVLLTGASGFIGQNVVPLLKKKGYTLRYATRDNWDTLPGLVRGVDAIVHLAGEIAINDSLAAPRERIEGNLRLDLDILEAVRKGGEKPRIIFTSTDRMYGRTKKHRVTEDEAPYPIEPYTASKIMGEVLYAAYANLFAIPYIILRFDSVYGPGQPRTMFISDVIQKAKISDEITTGLLATRKNFVYVDDVALSVVAALKAPSRALNEVYSIGGPPASLRQVLRKIQAIYRTRGRRITVVEESRPRRLSNTEVNPFALSTEKARRALGWRAKTPLYKGLVKTVEYFDSL
jgi:nucleoside-diphosphate-sugar epimerase